MPEAWSIRYDPTSTGPGWYVTCLSRGVPMRWGPYPSEPDAQAVQTRLITQYQRESTHGAKRPYTGAERVGRDHAQRRLL